MRPVSEFPQTRKQAVELAARLQRLIAARGAEMRDTLWAMQLIERKAAVARWRTGQVGEHGSRGQRVRQPLRP